MLRGVCLNGIVDLVYAAVVGEEIFCINCAVCEIGVPSTVLSDLFEFLLPLVHRFLFPFLAGVDRVGYDLLIHCVALQHRSSSINQVLYMSGARGYGDLSFTVHYLFVIRHHTLAAQQKVVSQTAEESFDLVLSAECICVIDTDPILLAIGLPF